MCDQCCDIELFTCGTKGQKQKTALIKSPRFHLLHVASPRLAATVYYFVRADTAHGDTTNVAHTNLLFRVVFFFSSSRRLQKVFFCHEIISAYHQ